MFLLFANFNISILFLPFHLSLLLAVVVVVIIIVISFSFPSSLSCCLPLVIIAVSPINGIFWFTMFVDFFESEELIFCIYCRRRVWLCVRCKDWFNFFPFRCCWVMWVGWLCELDISLPPLLCGSLRRAVFFDTLRPPLWRVVDTNGDDDVVDCCFCSSGWSGGFVITDIPLYDVRHRTVDTILIIVASPFSLPSQHRSQKRSEVFSKANPCRFLLLSSQPSKQSKTKQFKQKSTRKQQ